MTRSAKARSRKRRTPLQVMFKSVRVMSCANGELRVQPQWRGYLPWNEEDGGGPGVITRMAGASRLEWFINNHLKRGK